MEAHLNSKTGSSTAIKLANLAVLILSDSPSQRRLLQAYLTQLGHRPHSTASLVEATLAVESGSFDALLLDSIGPASRQLIQGCRLSGKPQLVLGVASDADDIGSAREFGFHSVLIKPVKLGDLRRVFAAGWADTPADLPLHTQPQAPGHLAEMHADLGPDAQALFQCIFQQDSVVQLATARAALEQPDFPLLRRAAHSLAGASANMGRSRLETFARRLECEAGLMTREAATGLLDAIAAELSL